MKTSSIEAWVILKRPSGDSSAWITCFTEQYGLISFYCRGALTPKRNGLLQAFSPLWLVYEKKGSRYFLNQVELFASPLMLFGMSLFAALYVNELLYHMLPAEEANPELYQLYKMTLSQLQHVSDHHEIAKILRHFEHELLTYTGYAINFKYDSNDNEIEEHLRYHYQPQEGFIPHPQGYPGLILKAIHERRWTEAQALSVAKLLYRLAIDSVLNGKEIKARALVHDYLKR